MSIGKGCIRLWVWQYICIRGRFTWWCAISIIKSSFEAYRACSPLSFCLFTKWYHPLQARKYTYGTICSVTCIWVECTLNDRHTKDGLSLKPHVHVCWEWVEPPAACICHTYSKYMNVYERWAYTRQTVSNQEHHVRIYMSNIESQAFM